jgi:hypothetical protein
VSSASHRVVAAYEQLLKQCHSLNMVNSTHINLGSLLIPKEVLALEEAVCADNFWINGARLTSTIPLGDVRRVSEDWLGKLISFHNYSAKPLPEPFERRELLNTLTLFSDGSDTSSKTLIIGFTGAARRLMMPSCSFLQSLEASRVDLAILRDIPFQGFSQGAKGIGDSLEAMQDRLPDMLNFSAYRQVSVIGTSGGCIAALLIALRLRLKAAMLVGIGQPDAPRWNGPDGITGSSLLRDAARNATLRASFWFGARSMPDQLAAEAVSREVAGTLVPVAGAGHNALYPLLQQNVLGEVLKKFLDI